MKYRLKYTDILSFYRELGKGKNGIKKPAQGSTSASGRAGSIAVWVDLQSSCFRLVQLPAAADGSRRYDVVPR